MGGGTGVSVGGGGGGCVGGGTGVSVAVGSGVGVSVAVGSGVGVSVGVGSGVSVGKIITGCVAVGSGGKVLTILGVLVGVGVTLILTAGPQAKTGKTSTNNNNLKRVIFLKHPIHFKMRCAVFPQTSLPAQTLNSAGHYNMHGGGSSKVPSAECTKRTRCVINASVVKFLKLSNNSPLLRYFSAR